MLFICILIIKNYIIEKKNFKFTTKRFFAFILNLIFLRRALDHYYWAFPEIDSTPLLRISIFRNYTPWNFIKTFATPWNFPLFFFSPLEFHQNSYNLLEFSIIFSFHILEFLKFKPPWNFDVLVRGGTGFFSRNWKIPLLFTLSFSIAACCVFLSSWILSISSSSSLSSS